MTGEVRRGPAHESSIEAVWAGSFSYFRRSGYLRRPSDEFASPDDRRWEVRFVLESTATFGELRHLLGKAGYEHESPFRERGKTMLAIFGRNAVRAIEELWDEHPPGRIGRVGFERGEPASYEA